MIHAITMVQQRGLTNSACSLSRRKVKSGCQTCKRRRVKCDEKRPICHRCESTGRVCDGYGIWGGGSHQSGHHQNCTSEEIVTQSNAFPTNSEDMKLLQPVQLVKLNQIETDCFEWFMYRSAVKLPGVFASHQWTILLFQASVAEPAVRHATLTLSSAHKEEVRGSGFIGRELDDEQSNLTVTQYSKAINSLQSCFNDDGKTSKHMTLISCALFVSAEFLRGHYTNGLTHLEYGLKLLLRLNSRVGESETSSTYVDGWLITVFTRFFVQAKLLGQLPKFSYQELFGHNLKGDLGTFNSIHHARRNLEHIMLCAMAIEEKSFFLTATEHTTEHINDLLNGRANAEAQLCVWLRMYQETVIESSITISTVERFAYSILELYYHLAVILVCACSEVSDELRFDRYTSTFLNILTYCINTHKLIYPGGKRTHNPKAHQDPELSSPNSISDIGWIAPLFVTAIKCRNHRIRKQAIKLLRSSAHREGIWNSDLAAAVACKVVEIEEEAYFKFLDTEDEFDKLDIPTEEELQLPVLPVSSRLNKIDIGLPEDRGGRLNLKCSRLQCNGMMETISQEYDLRTRRWTDSA